MPRPKTMVAMRPALRPLLFDAAAETRLSDIADAEPDLVVGDFADPRAAGDLAAAEVLITGWDCPAIDAVALDAMPRLRCVIHSGGSVKHHVTQACWDRGLVISSAAADNAVPVAEYTLAMIVSAGKRLPDLEREFRQARDGRDWLHWTQRHQGIGNHRRTIGIVGFSRVGRRVVELLRNLDAAVLVHDPYVSADRIHELGASPVELDDLVAASDVVSLHAPATAETRHLMDRRRLAMMSDGATLINTSRGALVDTTALIEELARGRIHAVIDVTEPDPLPVDSQLFEVPNLTLTPHVAGSLGGELRRLGDFVLDELERYAAGAELLGRVLPETLPSIA